MNKPEMGKEASEFWDAVIAGYDLNPAELQVVVLICKTLDRLKWIESQIDLGNLVMGGSRNNPIVNPLVVEQRQQVSLFTTLIKTLDLPSEGTADTAESRSEMARKAANARWNKAA